MASAFAAGDIAAFMGVEIGVSIAKANGGTEVVDPYSTPIGKVNIGLITTGALIEEDPELVQKVVDTHAATTEYMADNIEEWLPGMVEEFGGDEDVFTSALENFWLRSDLSDEYVGQLEALASAMAEIGLDHGRAHGRGHRRHDVRPVTEGGGGEPPAPPPPLPFTLHRSPRGLASPPHPASVRKEVIVTQAIVTDLAPDPSPAPPRRRPRPSPGVRR